MTLSLTSSLAPRLREALEAADFTYDGVAGLLGPRAHDALARNETTPGLARTGDGGPLSTLVRLFLLQTAVPLDAAERALPGLVDRLAVAGLLDQSVGEVAARLDCRPYATDDGLDLWVVSDLTPGLDGGPTRVTSDHVLGISAASTSLAQLTIREPVDSALDLGTGCGVQALHLAAHCRRVVATDVNPRALALARFNAALNQVSATVDVREGSFFEPFEPGAARAAQEPTTRDQGFDLIATNPPFVISPATGERLVYRDSGLPGDRVVEHLVRAAPRHLNPGGWCQVLANWVIETGRPWDERLAEWLDDDVDALVVQREVIDPAAYVELWLKDAGQHGAPDYHERYDTWLSWFDHQGIEAVGFGWINLHRPHEGGGRAGGRHDLLAWPYDVEQPIAPALHAWGTAVRTDVDAEALLVTAPGLVQETHGPVGVEDPETIVVRQQRGLRRARPVDTATAALVGACDGDLPVGRLIDAVAELLGQEPAGAREALMATVRELVDEGFLLRVDR